MAKSKRKKVKIGGIVSYTHMQQPPFDTPIVVAITNDMPDQEVGVDYGNNVGNWRDALANGDGVVTDMDAQDLWVEGSGSFSGYQVSVNKGSNYKRFRSLQGSPASLLGVPDPNIAEAYVAATDDAAKIEFVSKATKFQRALQGLVALGELRETIGLIKRPLKALRDYADNLLGASLEAKRRNKGRSKGALKRAMANTWLEWSFGAVPLMNDLLDGAKAASRIVTYHPPSKMIVGKAGTSINGDPVTGVIYAGGTGPIASLTKQSNHMVIVKYYGRVSASIPGAPATASQLGITFQDVIPAVWELVPYSFLVDYFTNIGDIIQAACFSTSSLHWVARTVRVESTNTLVNFQSLPYSDPPYETLEDDTLAAGNCDVKRTLVSRHPYYGSLIPSLRFEVPGLFSKKSLNIGALVTAGNLVNGKRPY